MGSNFLRCFGIVAAVHAGIVLVMLAFGAIKGLFKDKSPDSVPITFMQAPAVAEEPAHFVESEPEPAGETEPEPPPQKDPEPVETQPKRTPVEVSDRIVERALEQQQTPRITEDRIREALSEGVSQTRPVTDDRDRLYQELIRRRFHEAWAQPGAEETEGLIVKARISLGAGGRVTAARLVNGSGNPAMDRSVSDALESVDRIEGLSEEFVERNKNVTIAFEVQ